MTSILKLADTLRGMGATAMKLEAAPKRLRAGALLALVVGFGLMAYGFAKKGGGGDTGPLYLLATFLDSETDEITSDNGSAYKHGVDGQVTLGRPGAGRFRLDLGKFNPKGRGINIDLSACGASCDNIKGTEVAFLQSGTEFIPIRDGAGAIIGWSTPGDTALDFRSMKIEDGARYANFYAQLSADEGGLSRRFVYSRPEHPIEAWKCSDERAEPAKVVCTGADGSGTCVRWEVSGRNGCFRKALDSGASQWSSTLVEDVGFQVTLVPTP